MKYYSNKKKFSFRGFSSLKITQTVLVFFCIIPSFCIAETEEISRLSEEEIQAIYSRSWQLLSRIHIDISGLDIAIQLYEKVLALAPHDKDILWKLSECTFKKAEAMGKNERSLELYKKALSYAKEAREAYPNSIGAHFWVGCCSAKVAEIMNSIKALPIINEAKAELKKAIQIEPDHRFAILARAILARIYSNAPWPLRNLKIAAKYAEEAVEKDPHLTIASVTLARVLKNQKKIHSARREALRCLSILDPTYIWDAELYNWPDASRLLNEIKNQ